MSNIVSPEIRSDLTERANLTRESRDKIKITNEIVKQDVIGIYKDISGYWSYILILLVLSLSITVYLYTVVDISTTGGICSVVILVFLILLLYLTKFMFSGEELLSLKNNLGTFKIIFIFSSLVIIGVSVYMIVESINNIEDDTPRMVSISIFSIILSGMLFIMVLKYMEINTIKNDSEDYLKNTYPVYQEQIKGHIKDMENYANYNHNRDDLFQDFWEEYTEYLQKCKENILENYKKDEVAKIFCKYAKGNVKKELVNLNDYEKKETLQTLEKIYNTIEPGNDNRDLDKYLNNAFMAIKKNDNEENRQILRENLEEKINYAEKNIEVIERQKDSKSQTSMNNPIPIRTARGRQSPSSLEKSYLGEIGITKIDNLCNQIEKGTEISPGQVLGDQGEISDTGSYEGEYDENCLPGEDKEACDQRVMLESLEAEEQTRKNAVTPAIQKGEKRLKTRVRQRALKAGKGFLNVGQRALKAGMGAGNVLREKSPTLRLPTSRFKRGTRSGS